MKELATYVDLLLQLAEDSANVLSEVTTALAEDFGRKESLAFVNGSIALEPSGFMEDANIATTANGSKTALSPDALIALMYSLPATYRATGTWVMNGKTLATIRTLKDGHGNYLWQPSYQAGQQETILGRPVVEAVDMPDIAADATPVIFGDFKRGYPRFFNAIRHGHHRVIVGNDRKTGLPLDETEMPAFNLAMRTIYIIPVTKGRKGGDVGKVIADVVLIGLSAMTGGSAFMGTALRQSHGCPRPVSAVVAISFPLVRSALASVRPYARPEASCRQPAFILATRL
ncbi:phage major capsid protein [Paenirhodobacter populi]|uniref:phage major capsid protein n=1 Tax=Paenirhodobacter populi TaxID=2306993 RepID=UPI001F4D9CAD|nr:phage major capsid protein [Sinirhodobacter populi]